MYKDQPRRQFIGRILSAFGGLCTMWWRSAAFATGFAKPLDPQSKGKPASVENGVKQIIADQLGVKEARVVPQARLVDDLGADELDLVNVVFALEDAFMVIIPDATSEKWRTVDDVIGSIKSLTKASAGASSKSAQK